MKYTLITGATSGIGKELAFKYAKEGQHLILIARRIEILLMIKNQLEAKYDVSIRCIQCDLNNIDEMNQIMKKINDEFQIRTLINNAGMADFNKVEEISLASLQKQININLMSPILITKILIHNISNNKGSIINICSVLSYLPNSKSSVYTATKHALYGFSNTIRLEYPHIHVLTVHPGTVKTNFFKDDNYLNNTRRISHPQLVANKIYLAHKKKKRRCHVPKTIYLVNIFYQLFPRLMDFINQKYYSNK